MKGISVESLHGETGVVIIAVSDESKTFASFRRRIPHDVDFDDGAERSEQGVQIQLGRHRTDAVDVQRMAQRTNRRLAAVDGDGRAGQRGGLDASPQNNPGTRVSFFARVRGTGLVRSVVMEDVDGLCPESANGLISIYGGRR